MLDKETLQSLGMGVSDSYTDQPPENIRRRFDLYKSMGIRTIRSGKMGWASLTDDQGNWKKAASPYYDLMREYGFRLKLIAATIMGPPAWFVERHPDSRLVDENGRFSRNTISYWFPGAAAYTTAAADKVLERMKEAGYLDMVDALVVDFGPAGEPLYPPDWTQIPNGLDVPSGPEVFWCYDEHARADFPRAMKEKYEDIGSLNAAWGTGYASFDELEVPKPRTVKGTQWEDVLIWYRDAKRSFMEQQIIGFKKAIDKHSGGRIAPLLYIPGSDVTDEQWAEAVRTGDGAGNVRIMCDSRFIMDMGKKYDCILQYTGFENEPETKKLRAYLDAHGMRDIPFIGENAGQYECARDPENLVRIIKENRMIGIDYTHTRHLFKTDTLSKSAIYPKFERAMEELRTYIYDNGSDDPQEKSGVWRE